MIKSSLVKSKEREVPIVSMVIPVFNRAAFIGKTLDNVYQNNYRPIELILVNDGSTDNSLQVLEDFKRKYSSTDFQIKVINQPNEGAPAARNTGYRNSTGEYIQFLDSDDHISRDKFFIQIDLMKKNDADFALCNFEMVYVEEDNRSIVLSNSEGLKKILNAYGSFGCGSPLLTTQLANKISWNIELKRNQDIDYFQKAALLAKNICYTSKTLYSYVRHNEERISASYDKTVPVFDLRIKSLKQIIHYRNNLFFIYYAIFNLYVAFFKFNIKSMFKRYVV